MRIVEGGKGTAINYLGQRYVVDPTRKQKGTAILTHAHKDHARAFLPETIAHPATADLLEKKDLTLLGYGKNLSLGKACLRFENAGHIIGSSQALFDLEGKKILVTGDINPENTFLGKVKPVECDVMVIESTYGRPHYSFPPRQDIHSEIGSWLEKNSRQGKLSVMGARALGGAQEIVKIVNDLTSVTPFVTHQIHEYNKVYEKHGIKLGNCECVDCHGNGLRDTELVILPLQLLADNLAQALHVSAKKPVALAVASGWMLDNRGKRVKGFPLSAHAGFDSLLDFIEACDPGLVLTQHGFKEEFSRYVNRRLGISSRPLTSKGQKLLAEFL